MLKVLADEEQSSGVHSIYWNGRDDTGKQLSSGVYFLNLKAGEFSVIDRIVILR
jgi:flagellar hook assembly protein FlgD